MKNYKRAKYFRRILIVLVILIGIGYYNRVTLMQKIVSLSTESQIINIDKKTHHETENEQLANREFNGQSVVAVNQNHSAFSLDELKLTATGWQKLSGLDWLGRPQVANALLNKKLMPPAQKNKARERLTVQTPGYHAIKTGANESDWLYNRSHLIGYQFTGLNNEPKNLITCTRQLNADSRPNAKSMVTYETQVADYLRQSTSHYVRYQVTPVYRTMELVPRGVHMMAQSLNDNAINFNIYIFNVKDSWQINYQNGQATKGVK